MNASSVQRFQKLATRQRQVAELVRCYSRELAQWQQQLLRHSALLIIERTRGEWGLAAGELT